MAVIEIKKLNKYYGKHIGIQDVTFSVKKGEVFGFVGPNGAGKSTTIKILMGFIFAQGGRSSIENLDVAKDTMKIKTFTGYVPSDVRLYPNMKVKELLKMNANFYEGEYSSELKRLIDLFQIDENKHFHELSTGNKKKVSIVCALMANPKVIILDEPTNGLDPVMQRLLFEELHRRTKIGATVLLSSHNLSEVGEYCDRVAFIKDGSIIKVTDLSKENKPQKIVIINGGEKNIPDGFNLIETDGKKRKFHTTLVGKKLLQHFSEIAPADFTVQNESMEEYFWNLYGKENI